MGPGIKRGSLNCLAAQVWIGIENILDTITTFEPAKNQIDRHARAARIYDGPDEGHVHTVARRLLKLSRDGQGYRF